MDSAGSRPQGTDIRKCGAQARICRPGLMDTPMAVDTRARASNRSRAEVAAERDAKVPLRGRMGTAWDATYVKGPTMNGRQHL